MLVFQTWVPLFLSLCQTLLPGRCAVSQQILVVLQPESLPPPTGHKYGVYPTARSDYSDAYISRVT